MKFAPMAIPAMSLLQQHDARRDIVIEPAARRRAAIEARGHSELRAFGTGGVRNWGHNRAVKTHRLVLIDSPREFCSRLDVVYPGCAWSSSPACTWHCSLQYFFLPCLSRNFETACTQTAFCSDGYRVR